MSKYRSPKPLPDEHMRLVGIIAAHWQYVDLMIQRAVAEVMNRTLDDVCVLTENVGFQVRMDILMAYARPARDEFKDVWEEFTAMSNDVRDANELRNTYVHAAWTFEPDEPLPVRHAIRVRRGRIDVEDLPVTADELADAADRIWKAGERFTNFFRRVGMLAP